MLSVRLWWALAAVLLAVNAGAAVVVEEFGLPTSVALGDGEDLYWGFAIHVKTAVVLDSVAFRPRAVWPTPAGDDSAELVVAQLDSQGHVVSQAWRGRLGFAGNDFDNVTLQAGAAHCVLFRVDWRQGAQAANLVNNARPADGRNVVNGEPLFEDDHVAVFQTLIVWVPPTAGEAPYYGELAGYLPGVERIRYTPVDPAAVAAPLPRRFQIDPRCQRYTALPIVRAYFSDEGTFGVRTTGKTQQERSCLRDLTALVDPKLARAELVKALLPGRKAPLTLNSRCPSRPPLASSTLAKFTTNEAHLISFIG